VKTNTYQSGDRFNSVEAVALSFASHDIIVDSIGCGDNAVGHGWNLGGG
jgi:hypothetical protein